MGKIHTSFSSLKKKASAVGLLLVSLPAVFHAQTTYTFTSAGATGPTPPTAAQIGTAYASTNLNGQVGISAGIQTFTIPFTGPYRIAAIGAQGGYNGGNGAYVSGDYTLTAGTVLKILVGQTGSTNNNGSNASGGGGGGSFVASTGNVPYIVAGGGGGNGDAYNGFGNSTPCCRNGMEASLSTSGNGAAPSSTGGTSAGGGGAAGGGGTCGSSLCAGGGAGFYGNGSLCQAGSVAMSFTNGGAAGLNGGTLAGDGGFGGGGGCYNSGVGERGGGGGGYSGGGGGVANSGYDGAGGGGGCYAGNGASNITASLTTSTGDGKVIITQLCDVHVTSTPTNPAICAGQSITLTTLATSNITWSNGSTTQSIVVSPSSTSSYTVSGTSSVACNAGSGITVTVSPGVPVLTITPSALSTCLGNTVSIGATGALTYTFSNSIGNGTPFTPPLGVTNYTIKGGNGCGVTTTVVPINITQLPINVVASSTLVCAGKPATLTASGANNYTWTPGPSSFTTFIVNPSVNTTYTVTGLTGSCTGLSYITVQTNPNPTLTASTNHTMICAGDPVNLVVTGNATSYTWSPSGLPGTTITDNPGNTTLYTVTGANALGCTAYAQQVVIVNSLPVVGASASSQLVCSTDAVTLTANGAVTYAWTGGSNANTSTMVVNPITDATYTVTGTNSLSCSASTVVTVNVYVPTIVVSSNTTICIGNSASIGAGAADSWMWSNGANSQNTTVSPTLNTVYTVTASVNNLNGLSCPATNTVMVSINPSPSITAVTNHTAICVGNSAVLTADGAGATGTYTWTGGSGVVTTVNNTVTPIANLTYTVRGTDANGCKGMAIITQVVSPCTGIAVNQADNLNVSVYPNPNSGEFTISTDQVITLQIINELGQQVKVINISKNTTDVKVSGLANGVYFITGKNENGTVKQKIVIAK